MRALPDGIREICERAIGTPVNEVQTVTGGDISEARRLLTDKGSFFLKLNPHPQAPDMFRTEAAGLGLLAQSTVFRIPQILASGGHDGYGFLLLEFIAPGRRSQTFWEAFGRSLAALHHPPQAFFGLDFDNYIGRLPQPNGRHEDFLSFYLEKRLLPQGRQALDQGLLNSGDIRRLELLGSRLGKLLPQEPPSLIHGDLWSGNFLVAESDQPVLIDPAVSFAHRELDLAMSLLFGGFDARFYEAYQEAYPTAPQLDERIELYQLYYLLVHVNLFGNSYTGTVRRILERFGG